MKHLKRILALQLVICQQTNLIIEFFERKYNHMVKANGMQIVKRIDSLLAEKGEKRPQLCKAIDIPLNNLSNWSLRGTVPQADVLYNIAEYLDTSIEYLLTGNKELTEKPLPENKISMKSDLSKEELILLAKYKAIPSLKEKAIINDLIDDFNGSIFLNKALYKALQEIEQSQ